MADLNFNPRELFNWDDKDTLRQWYKEGVEAWHLDDAETHGLLEVARCAAEYAVERTLRSLEEGW